MQTFLNPHLLSIQAVLRRIDGAVGSNSSCQDVEASLIDEVASLLDEALPWQRGHGRRTARFAQTLGATAGCSGDTLRQLRLASVLHDIGLLALPSDLFSSSGYLDESSYVAVQCHPRLGAQWLQSFRFLQVASVIIAHHHERWDGSGYPYGIRGTLIPREARILAIADAFDAINVPGADSQIVRDQVAYRILQAAAGTQFDPQLVELCGQVLNRLLHEEAAHTSPALFSL